jgi:NarL family two-component system response regulator LiaR
MPDPLGEDGVLYAVPPEPLRVVVADPDPLVRRLLRRTLEDAGIAVLYEAVRGAETVDAVLHHRPDLLLLEARTLDSDGLEVIRRVHRGGDGVAVVVFTSGVDEEFALSALRAGAIGYVSKDIALESLPAALFACARGEAVVSRTFARRVLDHLQSTPPGSVGLRPIESGLTSRQWEVLDLLASHASTDDIADQLVVSVDTVRSHIKQIMRRLDAHSRAEAIQKASALRARGPGCDAGVSHDGRDGSFTHRRSTHAVAPPPR